MLSREYLKAWGFPEVFKEVDQLVDVRTRVCRQEMEVVKRGQSRRFDLFWEFEREHRIRRVVFELKRVWSRDFNILKTQIDSARASYLDLRPIVLVPGEDEQLNLELKERFARDVIVLPGREHMRIDANGALSLPPIEVTRTYCSPREVIRFELRTVKGLYDVRRLLMNPSPFAYDQLGVVADGDLRPSPFFRYVERLARSRGHVSRRGMTREFELQFENPIRLIGPAGSVFATGLNIVYAASRRIKSFISVSPVALELSRVANEEMTRDSCLMDRNCMDSAERW